MTETRLDEMWTKRIEEEIFPKVFKDANDFARRYTIDAKQAESDLIKAALEQKFAIPFDIKVTLARVYASLMTLEADGPKAE